MTEKYATLHVPTATGVAGYSVTLGELDLLLALLARDVARWGDEEEALHTKLIEIRAEMARPGHKIFSRDELLTLARSLDQWLLKGEVGNG